MIIMIKNRRSYTFDEQLVEALKEYAGAEKLSTFMNHILWDYVFEKQRKKNESI